MTRPDIWIVGLGIRSVDQITREAERAIRHSHEVLFVDTSAGTREYLATLCPRVTDLVATSYEERERRVGAYRHMAARVIDAALTHPPVTFAMHGHPLVFSYPPFLIRDLARALDLSVEIQPGVSATDTIFADLGIDPSIAGLQMYEATELLLRRRPLQPDVPALLWQIGNLESSLHTQRVSRPERFHRLRDYLLGIYPAEHVAHAVYSSPHPLMDSVVHDVAIGALPDHAETFHAGFSLYIPAATTRPIADPELAELLDDPAHLGRVTR